MEILVLIAYDRHHNILYNTLIDQGAYVYTHKSVEEQPHEGVGLGQDHHGIDALQVQSQSTHIV